VDEDIREGHVISVTGEPCVKHHEEDEITRRRDFTDRELEGV
jgi:hypothetical protein